MECLVLYLGENCTMLNGTSLYFTSIFCPNYEYSKLKLIKLGPLCINCSKNKLLFVISVFVGKWMLAMHLLKNSHLVECLSKDLTQK